MEKRFSGGSQTWDDPAYTVKGSNITPDPDTAAGGDPRLPRHACAGRAA
jgi:hypothetical protein